MPSDELADSFEDAVSDFEEESAPTTSTDVPITSSTFNEVLSNCLGHTLSKWSTVFDEFRALSLIEISSLGSGKISCRNEAIFDTVCSFIISLVGGIAKFSFVKDICLLENPITPGHLSRSIRVHLTCPNIFGEVATRSRVPVAYFIDGEFMEFKIVKNGAWINGVSIGPEGVWGYEEIDNASSLLVDLLKKCKSCRDLSDPLKINFPPLKDIGETPDEIGQKVNGFENSAVELEDLMTETWKVFSEDYEVRWPLRDFKFSRFIHSLYGSQIARYTAREVDWSYALWGVFTTVHTAITRIDFDLVNRDAESFNKVVVYQRSDISDPLSVQLLETPESLERYSLSELSKFAVVCGAHIKVSSFREMLETRERIRKVPIQKYPLVEGCGGDLILAEKIYNCLFYIGKELSRRYFLSKTRSITEKFAPSASNFCAFVGSFVEADGLTISGSCGGKALNVSDDLLDLTDDASSDTQNVSPSKQSTINSCESKIVIRGNCMRMFKLFHGAESFGRGSPNTHWTFWDPTWNITDANSSVKSSIANSASSIANATGVTTVLQSSHVQKVINSSVVSSGSKYVGKYVGGFFKKDKKEETAEVIAPNNSTILGEQGRLVWYNTVGGPDWNTLLPGDDLVVQEALVPR